MLLLHGPVIAILLSASADAPLASPFPQATFLPSSVAFASSHLILRVDGVETTERDDGVGWQIAGATGGALTGAALGGLVGLSLASSNPNYQSNGPDRGGWIAIGVGEVLGAAAAGVGGWFLGRAARRGSSGAKIGTVFLDAVGLILGALDLFIIAILQAPPASTT